MSASHHCEIEVRGERLCLLPERALWWPARRMLLVADVHIGKAAAFRSLGQPVPSGTTDDNLSRLSALARAWPAQQLVLLGDFLHARASRTPAVLSALRQWRDALPADLQCVLVRGNHDRHAGDPPSALGIEPVTEPWVQGPFALCHLPGVARGGYGIAGHLHPACTLRSGSDALRLPCFVFGEHGAILPAFGAFTGHAGVPRVAGQRRFVVGGGRVWPVPGG